MKKSQVETTAQNLEERFDRGEDVLDYFDVTEAKAIEPEPTSSSLKTKSSGSYSIKRDSEPSVIVREKSASYQKVAKGGALHSSLSKRKKK